MDSTATCSTEDATDTDVRGAKEAVTLAAPASSVTEMSATTITLAAHTCSVISAVVTPTSLASFSALGVHALYTSAALKAVVRSSRP